MADAAHKLDLRVGGKYRLGKKIGSGSFRRKLVERLPHPIAQRMIQICDTLEAELVKLVNEKKAALAQGDEALKHQVGEGKDILSILCKLFCHACARMRLTNVIPSESQYGGLGRRQAPG